MSTVDSRTAIDEYSKQQIEYLTGLTFAKVLDKHKNLIEKFQFQKSIKGIKFYIYLAKLKAVIAKSRDSRLSSQPHFSQR